MLLKEKIKSNKILLTIILFTVMTKNVMAINNEELKIEDIYKSVNNFYPTVNITQLEKDIAGAKLLANEGLFDTTFNAKSDLRPVGYYRNSFYDFYVEQPTKLWGTRFFTGWRAGLGDFPDYEGKNITNSLGEFRTGFEIPLLKDGYTDRARTNIEQAKMKEQEAELKLLKKRVEVGQEAADKYWKWVSAAKNYIITKEIYNIALDRDNKIQESAKLGNIAPIEIIENKRIIFQRQASMISAQRNLDTASNELSIYLRDLKGNIVIPKLSQVPTVIKYEPLKATLSESLRKAYLNSPDLKLIDNNIESFNAEIFYLNNQRLPIVDLTAALSQDTGLGDKSRSPVVFETGFKVKAPLWMRNAEGKIKEQEIIINQKRIEYNLIKDKIRAEVNNAYIALKASLEQLDFAKQELELSISLEKAEKEKFMLGDSNLLFMNIREQAVADARMRQINAIISYNQTLAIYKATIYEP